MAGFLLRMQRGRRFGYSSLELIWLTPNTSTFEFPCRFCYHYLHSGKKENLPRYIPINPPFKDAFDKQHRRTSLQPNPRGLSPAVVTAPRLDNAPTTNKSCQPLLRAPFDSSDGTGTATIAA